MPALLWGIAFAHILNGVPIGPSGDYVGSFLDLLQPYALLGGVTFLLLFSLQGALFLALRTTDEFVERSGQATRLLWPFTAAAVAAFLAWSYVNALATYHGHVPRLLICRTQLRRLTDSSISMGAFFLSLLAPATTTSITDYLHLFLLPVYCLDLLCSESQVRSAPELEM